VLEEPVEYCGCCGHVSDEFSPVFDGSVGGHDGRAVFVSPHNDLEEVFARTFRQLFHAHVVDDEHVGFEVFRQHFLLAAQRFVVQEVTHHIEN